MIFNEILFLTMIIVVNTIVKTTTCQMGKLSILSKLGKKLNTSGNEDIGLKFGNWVLVSDNVTSIEVK